MRFEELVLGLSALIECLFYFFEINLPFPVPEKGGEVVLGVVVPQGHGGDGDHGLPDDPGLPGHPAHHSLRLPRRLHWLPQVSQVSVKGHFLVDQDHHQKSQKIFCALRFSTKQKSFG